MIEKIRKRDGTLEEFNPVKIEKAIEKAFAACKKSPRPAKRLSKEVVKSLERSFKGEVLPSVEDVQDIVEETLIKNKYPSVAKAYILYRKKKQELREFKTFLGIRDDLKLKPNAIRVLAARYLLKDNKGNIIETPARLFRRVAHAVAQADSTYSRGKAKQSEEKFYSMMSNLEFLPNTPTLMNAGTPLGQLSACFVLPIEDNLVSIFETLKHMALIHQGGGGTGFSFSKIRPRGDIVKSTKGVASGPVSFMRVYDTTTEVMKQGGKRRGANMGILAHNHPEIQEFIQVKSKTEWLENFNISVSATDNFMRAVREKKKYALINPRTGKKVREVNAQDVFDMICENAWRNGDPGLIFIDEINRKNPTASLGLIESTNPCGEQPLHNYESCNLGSINLVKMLKGKTVDWKKLKSTVNSAIHFLDNVIDVNHYPLKQIEEMTKSNRRVGLGVMGFAEMLIKLGIPYDSQKAIDFAEKLMKFINTQARAASNALAKERGSFPNFEKSTWSRKLKATRNATVTTIAPTGTLSIIAGVTSGIEPIFALSYVRNILGGAHLLEVNSAFEEIARDKKFYSKRLMMEIAKTGSVQGLKEVPKRMQRLFRNALEIKPEWHIKMQAAFQKHTENAVSKTINLHENASVSEVKRAYLLAHKLKCKGITIYRYGSKKNQVLTRGAHPDSYVSAKPYFSGGRVCELCD